MLTFLDILIGLLTFAITVIPLFKNVMLRPKVYPSIGFLRRITKSGWTVIVLGFILIGVVFLKDWYFDNEETKDQNKLVDRISTNFDTSLKRYNLRYDKETGKVLIDTIVLQTVEAKEQPLLNISEGPKFLFDRMTKDTIPIMIRFKNLKNGIAKNFITKVVTIREDPNEFTITNNVQHKTNSEHFISKEEGYTIIMGYKYGLNTPEDIIYIYFNSSYSDENSLNTKHVKRIFKIPYPINTQVLISIVR